jgi:hypothetical protein
MGVAEDHRPPGADVVYVPIAVEVEEVGPPAPLEEDRFPTDASKGAGGAVDAAGHELFGAGKRGLTFLSRHGEVPGSFRYLPGKGKSLFYGC